jgi:hypothetical protein
MGAKKREISGIMQRIKENKFASNAQAFNMRKKLKTRSSIASLKAFP